MKEELAKEMVNDIRMMYSLSCTEFEQNVKGIFEAYEIHVPSEQIFDELLTRILTQD